MSAQPRYSVQLSALDRILQAVNIANPNLPAALSSSNVQVGLPSVMPTPTDSGIDTSVTLSAVAGSGYTDAITVYYPRTDLGQLFSNGMTVVGDNVQSWAALATAVNTAHKTVLTTADLPTSAFHIDTLPAQLTVALPATSLLYKGTVTVALSGSQPALSTAVTVTALSGLNAPTAPSSPSDLTQSAATLIYGLVNAANPAIPNGGLSSINAILGTPTATGATPNTSLPIASAANQGYTGYVTVMYHRLDIQTEVSDPLVPAGLQLADSSTTPYGTVLDLLPAINTALAVNLQASDIANGSTAIIGTTYPKAVSVVLAASCLTLVGTLTVSIIQPVALGAMVTSQSLNGFELPQLQ